MIRRPTFDTNKSDRDIEETAAAVNPKSPNATTCGTIFTIPKKLILIDRIEITPSATFMLDVFFLCLICEKYATNIKIF